MNSPIIITSEQSQNPNLADLETKKDFRDPSSRVPREEAETKEMKKPLSKPLHKVTKAVRREMRIRLHLRENTFETFEGTFTHIKPRRMGKYFSDLRNAGYDITKNHREAGDLKSAIEKMDPTITLCPYTREEILQMGKEGKIVIKEKRGRKITMRDIGNMALFTNDGKVMTGEVFMGTKTLMLYDYPDEYK